MDETMVSEDWWIFHGRVSKGGEKTIDNLPPPPPWRPKLVEKAEWEAAWSTASTTTYRATPHEILLVNAALYLRRPLLVTGKPGTGKSTLAGAVAAVLGLGPVLTWPINTRSTLQDGLYSYDAIGRLRDASMQRQGETAMPREAGNALGRRAPSIGEYLTLRALGTALLPWKRPRVLLIDEIDKSDVDLPNDLLHVFEEGRFEIPELSRDGTVETTTTTFGGDTAPTEVTVHTADKGRKATIEGSWVQHHAFPLVIMTSNGERAFPPAFKRRCLELEIQPPDDTQLARIVKAHLGTDGENSASSLIAEFLQRRGDRGKLATDQLLNAVFLASQQIDLLHGEALLNVVLKELGEG